ncbi:CDP-glycerol glycerophosphotransferase family protein [Rhodohalobacter halophilus]|uniref:CDP-glycerol glycerophosphotransferase family protein n=1 Tax=Rhodohalobacter halophilus TaxID=1812810 RepID=UPI00083F90E8|nr:CDP-glycerol glycerophosphotransferase family protein [Rhodohalobacter halophilus]
MLKYRFSPIDYFLSSSEIVTEIFSKRFNLTHDQFIHTGYPMYDSLKNNIIPPNFSDVLPKPRCEYNCILLYAPTFRKKNKTKWFPFSDFTEKKLEQVLQKYEALLILRPHPNEKLDSTLFKAKNDRIVVMDHHTVEDTTELLKIADCIITDYSGIYIEGLLVDLPPILIPYDLAQYERWLPLPYHEITPGPKVSSFKEFTESLKQSVNNKEKYQADRERVRKIYFSNFKRGATKRVINFLETL